jgi:sugar phosphate isomerase/epimerase
MKIGMTSNTLNNESIENVFKYAKQAGLEGIEWSVVENHIDLNNPETYEKVKEFSQKENIAIFSLGSYARMTDPVECDKTLDAAIRMGAPIIRLWAGPKSPHKCSPEDIDLVVKNTIDMAKKAEKHNIKLGFEYHGGTLTETAPSAVELMKKINCSNVGLYWQPSGNRSIQENLEDRAMVLPYCIGNIHIQNYVSDKGYGLLDEITDRIHTFFDDIKECDYNIMIEFVKDGTIENLMKDAETLKNIIK